MAKKHHLIVDVPFTLYFPDGGKVTAEVRLREYGAENGMLLFSDYSILKDRENELVEMGYSYSCLSQPSEDKIDSDEGLIDLLCDWRKT